jgi:hypothetical protein
MCGERKGGAAQQWREGAAHLWRPLLLVDLDHADGAEELRHLVLRHVGGQAAAQDKQEDRDEAAVMRAACAAAGAARPSSQPWQPAPLT